MKWSKSLILFITLFLSMGTFAQESAVKVSDVVQEINGKQYYLHKVQKGETLSSISRAYHCTVDDIRSGNYGLSDQISPGDFLKVPVMSENLPQANQSDGRVNYRRIAKGETLYSLAQEFNVSVEDIKAANGGLEEGLKTGGFIKIPVSQTMHNPPAPQTKSERQEQKDYFEFQAKEKTSVYTLAIKYRVSIDEIRSYNPGLDEDINEGEIIKIPLNTRPREFITHTVTQRQTMNRVARNYNLDVEALKEINPYISRHLEEGQVLRIPLPKIEIKETKIDSLQLIEELEITEVSREKSQEDICYEMIHDSVYNVALVLPFYLSVYDSVKTVMLSEQEQAPPDMYIKPYVFIQFYEGFLMAADSMRKAGLDVKIHVYNVEDNIDQAKMLIKNPGLKSMDLIVGPVFNNPFKVVADFAAEHHINIVNPFSTREEISRENPFVFQLQPVFSDQYSVLINYLNKYHDYAQIFVARHNPYRDEVPFSDLKNALNRDLESRQGNYTGLYNEIIYSRDSTYALEHLASIEHKNIVIVYSENKLFILDLMRKLNELRDTFDIMVVGMPNWKDIDGLEPEDMNNLNTHILSKDYINYQHEPVRKFLAAFRQKYASEPREYAFTGYNTGIYFLSALMKYGPAFNDCIQYYDMEVLSMGIDFESTPGNGFRNLHWNMLGMENYRYVKKTAPLETYDLSKPPARYYKYMESDY